MDKILPCPFCGSNSVIADRRGTAYSAACSDCGAEGPAHLGSIHVCDIDSEEAKAITAWNTRHTPEGWRTVPVELNMEMAWEITASGKTSGELWESVLAAAPKWGGE